MKLEKLFFSYKLKKLGKDLFEPKKKQNKRNHNASISAYFADGHLCWLVSDTGTLPPESCVFGQFLNIAAVLSMNIFKL